MQQAGMHETVGVTLGGICGFAKSLTMMTVITWSVVCETALLAAIGAAVGFIITAIMKRASQKFTSWKSTRTKN